MTATSESKLSTPQLELMKALVGIPGGTQSDCAVLFWDVL